MGLLNKAVSMQYNFTGAESFATWNPGYDLRTNLSTDSYASAYPSIRAIAQSFMQVAPYAINAKGEKVENVPAINALYHPNRTDSAVAFAEKLATSTLVNRNTYILVWHREGRNVMPGGKITPANIAGFTFLEGYSIAIENGRTVYKRGSTTYDESEVMCIPGGVYGYDLYAGYSPTQSAYRWLKLDDYIADFQAGFFENGAVPAGQFVITAGTTKEYNDVVDTLQERHRGAGNNNNVTYAHRPLSSGSTAPAQIEWVSFSQSNKDIDFANLFEQTNRRIDTSYGAPAMVKGFDDSSTYATAQVAKQSFAEFTVYPLLLRNYTQITHELNRITNGLGVAITFKYDIPAVDDAEKVQAETKNIHADMIIKLATAGYSVDSVVDAFGLPITYKGLTLGNTAGSDAEDNPNVDEGSEVNNAPVPETLSTPTNRGSDGTNPKAAAKLVAFDEDKYRKEIAKVTSDFMQAQIDNAIKTLDDNPENAADYAEDDQQAFVDAMLAVIIAIMIDRGELQYAEGAELLLKTGIDHAPLSEFVLSDQAKVKYQDYLTKVGKSYGDDTADAIRKQLAQGQAESWTRKQTKDALTNIMKTDEWRVDRMVNTELNRSMSVGGLEGMKQIEAETGVQFEKSLYHPQGAECEFCRAEEGRWISINEPMLRVDSTLTGEDGGLLVNKFADLEAGGIHPNCGGNTVYRVVGA